MRCGIEGLQIRVGDWRRGIGRSGGRGRIGIQRIRRVRLGIKRVIGGGKRWCRGVGVLVGIGGVRNRVRVRVLKRRVLVIWSGGVISVLHR